MYISLHNHSHFSLLDGYSKPEEIVKRAKELGQHSIALTDHGTLSGILPFYKECKTNGIKPIIGCEFYMCPTVLIKDRSQLYHLIVFAKNNEGYRNLLTLDTLAYQNFFYKPRIDFDMLEEYKNGLIVTSACLGGIINTDGYVEYAKRFKNIFHDDFYLEIQDNSLTEQHSYNERLIKLSKDLNIPLIITTDSHAPTRELVKYQHIWFDLFHRTNGYTQIDDSYIKSEQEIVLEMSKRISTDIIRQAIENTGIIAEQCDVTIEVTGNHFPVFPVDDQMKAVKDICRIGWKQKILPKKSKDQLKEYQSRLVEELKVLEQCNYLNYLLITHDILNWCKNHDILTGIGRGSCGGSLVCYLMDITKIDPIEHGLLFQRFVNIERVSAADIDDDIEDTRRQEVIEYIKEKYGEVYNIRTFNYLGTKGSIQRACQALHVPPKETTELSKNTDDLDDVEGYDEVVDIARHFKGLLHSWGCHASAVMIFPDAPTNYNPIEKQKDTFVAAYDYHDLENMSLVKLDILGLRNLTVIHDTLRMLKNPPDIEALPLDDAEVYQQYAEGNTKGIFQVESPGMRQFAKSMNVSCFDDVVALIALYRPGPLDSGMAQQYVDGKNGGEVECLHPKLEAILGSTHQVIVYQEQVMKIAQELAGFTLGQADNLRKVIGRKELDKDEHGKTPVDYAVESFVSAAIDRGVTEDVAVEVGRQISACGRYIFNKSHAAAYGMTSYITAYLKCHYPTEYMCSLLNSTIGDIDRTVEYFKEVQRMGIEIVKPNLQVCNERWTIDNGRILYALHAIKGIGKNLNATPCGNLLEVINSNSKGVTEALIKSGSLDFFGHSRALMLSNLTTLQDMLKRQQQCSAKIAENKQQLDNATTEKDRKKYSRQLQQWQQKLDECNATVAQQETGEYDEIQGEVEVLGFSFQEIPKVKLGKLVKIFKKLDKNASEMAWLTMDTNYGEFRCTVFAKGWTKISNEVKQGESYEFVVSDSGILTEIRIDGTVVKTNERRRD